MWATKQVRFIFENSPSKIIIEVLIILNQLLAAADHAD